MKKLKKVRLSDKLSYDIAEVKKLTSISRSKIYDAMNDGSLPAYKAGDRTIIRKVDLKRWLKNLQPYTPKGKKAVRGENNVSLQMELPF